jgi:signal peptidase I
MLVVLLAARSSLADWNVVPTGSMNPTIIEGDRVFVNKLAYGLKVPFTTWHVARWDAPARGEVVVFFAPHDGTRMVKRVVGVPRRHRRAGRQPLVVKASRRVRSRPTRRRWPTTPGSRTGQHRFATETTPGGPPHPVMSTPGPAEPAELRPGHGPSRASTC